MESYPATLVGLFVASTFLFSLFLGMAFMGIIAANIRLNFWKLFWYNMKQPAGVWKRALPRSYYKGKKK